MSLNDYEIVRSIGKGSYGEVSLIQHKKERKQYVIKKMALQRASKRERKAAELEAKLLSKLKHPNIVSYKDSFESDDGFLYIVMGFAEGGDLYTKLREQREKNEFLTEVQVVRWFIQICMAIQYLHQKRILHRDLKTQNIFLTKTKMIKVGDLGIARVLESNNDMATTLIGTPYYMSPELFSNKPYNYKSDVWALGCCVYEMITLRHAFNAKDMNSLVYKILKKKMPKMPDLYSGELCELIKIMLHQSAEKRPSVNRILRNSFIKKHIQLFLDESSKSRRPRSGKKKDISSRKSSVASNHSRTNSASSVVSQSPLTPVILSPKEKSEHIYEVIVDPVVKSSHDNHHNNQQPQYENVAMKYEPVKHTYVNVRDFQEMRVRDDVVKEKGKLVPSPPPASKPSIIQSESKLVDTIKDKIISTSSPAYSHTRTPSGDKRNELTESGDSISSSITEGRVSSARERRRQEQRRKREREREISKGSGDCQNFASKNSEFHSPSPPITDKDQILKENQRLKGGQKSNRDQEEKGGGAPKIKEEQRVPLVTDSPRKRKESADEDQFYTLLHTTLKISEDSPPDTPPNTNPADQGLSPVPELSESSGSSIHLEEKEIKSKPLAPPSGNTPQATAVSFNLPQHLHPPTSNITGISQSTLASTGKLMNRIVALRKDCIHGLGVPLLHRAYELLDSNEEEDVLETKLVELLGEVRFKQWAGKIWQLKFCEESIFKHCGSITAY